MTFWLHRLLYFEMSAAQWSSCFTLVTASFMPHWPFWLFLFQLGGSQLHASLTFLAAQVAVLWDEHSSVDFLFQPGDSQLHAWLTFLDTQVAYFEMSTAQLISCFNLVAASFMPHWPFWIHRLRTLRWVQLSWFPVSTWWQPASCLIDLSGYTGCRTLRWAQLSWFPVSTWWQPASCLIDLSGCSCFNLVAASFMPHWPFWLFLFQPGGSQLHASLTFLVAQVALLWDECGDGAERGQVGGVPAGHGDGPDGAVRGQVPAACRQKWGQQQCQDQGSQPGRRCQQFLRLLRLRLRTLSEDHAYQALIYAFFGVGGKGRGDGGGGGARSGVVGREGQEGWGGEGQLVKCWNAHVYIATGTRWYGRVWDKRRPFENVFNEGVLLSLVFIAWCLTWGGRRWGPEIQPGSSTRASLLRPQI